MSLSETQRILVVEDNPADVRLIREALASDERSPELQVCASAEEAWEWLQAHSSPQQAPDLIFLDLNLPRRDGRDLLWDIKVDKSLRRIPLVVLTTSDSDRDVLRSYGCFANCYLKKPVDLDRFIHMVRTCHRFWTSVVRLPARADYPPKSQIRAAN